MNRGLAAAVGVAAVVVLILGFVALSTIDRGDPGAPSATPTTADITPSPDRTDAQVSPSPTDPLVSPTGQQMQASPSPVTQSPSPAPGTSPTPQPSPTSGAVAMTGPSVPQGLLWLGAIPLLIALLVVRSVLKPAD